MLPPVPGPKFMSAGVAIGVLVSFGSSIYFGMFSHGQDSWGNSGVRCMRTFPVARMVAEAHLARATAIGLVLDCIRTGRSRETQLTGCLEATSSLSRLVLLPASLTVK